MRFCKLGYILSRKHYSFPGRFVFNRGDPKPMGHSGSIEFLRGSLVPGAGCGGALRTLLNGANIDLNPVKGDRLILLSGLLVGSDSGDNSVMGRWIARSRISLDKVRSLNLSDGRPGKVYNNFRAKASR